MYKNHVYPLFQGKYGGKLVSKKQERSKVAHSTNYLWNGKSTMFNSRVNNGNTVLVISNFSPTMQKGKVGVI